MKKITLIALFAAIFTVSATAQTLSEPMRHHLSVLFPNTNPDSMWRFVYSDTLGKIRAQTAFKVVSYREADTKIDPNTGKKIFAGVSDIQALKEDRPVLLVNGVVVGQLTLTPFETICLTATRIRAEDAKAVAKEQQEKQKELDKQAKKIEKERLAYQEKQEKAQARYAASLLNQQQQNRSTILLSNGIDPNYGTVYVTGRTPRSTSENITPLLVEGNSDAFGVSNNCIYTERFRIR